MVNEKIPVQICGLVYYVESDVEPLELHAIAKYVEDRLTEISSSTNTQQTTSKIAILACLNIACELFRLKANHENLNRLVNTKADELISVIDSSLK